MHRPYRCPARLWTVGVGHVIDPSHLQVPFESRLELPIPDGWDRTLTDDEVNEILAVDLQKFLGGVLRLCACEPFSNRHLALTSFAFNIGLGALQASTLRMKHNRGEYQDAADQFRRWVFSAGQRLRGLEIRREDERALYVAV